MTLYRAALVIATLTRRRRRARGGGASWEILLTGTFYSSNWLAAHIHPLAASERCSLLYVVSTHPVPKYPKVVPIYPPRWLQRLVGYHVGSMEMTADSSEGQGMGGDEREVLFYRNPMDPTITSPVPAKDEMGMDYVPVYAGEAARVVGQGSGVTIDPSVIQNINVQTAPVSRRDLTHPIRTVGYLEYDQERMVTVTTKYSGWVEKVYVNYVGEPVRKGQPLFEIYSPELVQTEQELLSAIEYAKRFSEQEGDARSRAEALVEAARTRLSYPQVPARRPRTSQFRQSEWQGSYQMPESRSRRSAATSQSGSPRPRRSQSRDANGTRRSRRTESQNGKPLAGPR